MKRILVAFAFVLTTGIVTLANARATDSSVARATDALRPHQSIGVATEAGGNVTMPADASQARLTVSGAYLYRINSAGFADGDEILIYLPSATPANKIDVVNGATRVGSFLPLELGGAGTSYRFRGPTALWFWLNLAEGRWCLKTFVMYVVQK
jgi:hypothetical protein